MGLSVDRGFMWRCARADVSHQTARSVCWTGSRLGEAPEVARQLASGEISFDRAEQLARLPEGQRSDHEGYDISQLNSRVARYRRRTYLAELAREGSLPIGAEPCRPPPRS
jgi:hypothetical protein